jgi:extracellular factor (EF) 3-hydroxypalmitic acid methyl ester biosynthesis protein
LTIPLHRVRNYEELDGAQGREVFFRPQRYRALDLLPLQCQVVLALGGRERPGPLLDVSQNGAAFEWPSDLPLVSVGDRIESLAVRFDAHEPYRGEARVGSVRDLNGTRVVGVSFEGPLLPIDGILELRAIKTFAQKGLPPAVWRAPGHERFKVLISELRLYLEDVEPQLRRLEGELPWHVLHGERSPARSALIEKIRTTVGAEILRVSEEIDAASRNAPFEDVQAMVQWSRRHLHTLLMQAPSMHRAANKPFGYAGDYEVMRFIYEKPFEGPTLFAKSISLAFDQSRAACAVRHRKDLVKRELRTLIESKRRPVRVLAVACGPAQELLELFAEVTDLPAPVEIVVFDQDKGALAYAYRRLKPVIDPLHGRVKGIYLHDSIKRLLRDPNLFAEFGAFDLIYSVGLFDYMRETTAVVLARNLVARLAPGGRALIANMVPANPSRWYMEYHLDWFLNYRTHAQLLEVGARAAPGARLNILEEESRVNPFVEIQRD